MTPEQAIDKCEDISRDLEARIADFPSPTCPSIDAVLSECAPLAIEIDRLQRQGDDASHSEMVDAIDQVDTLFRFLPDQLEELREQNDQLRTALHEALDSRKSAAESLVDLAGQIEVIA